MMNKEINVFYIHCPNSDCYFQLCVDPNLDCDACVSPEYIIDPYTGKVKIGRIGWIRFKSIYIMTSGVIAHESVHMAATYVRVMLYDKNLDLGMEIGRTEEKFAYLVGHFASEISKVYYNLVNLNDE